MLYSHIAPPDDNNSDWRCQSTEQHNIGVADRAAGFAASFGFGDIAKIMGLLHDKGKEQAAWQKYLQGVTGFNKEYARILCGPNHSYVGAIIAQKLYPQIAPFIAQPIAGHHRGLYDYCTYIEETKKDVPADVTIDKAVPYQIPNLSKGEKYDLHHIIRMLFSCLVDADSLDTEAFLNPEQAQLRGSHTSMQELLAKLEKHLQGLRSDAADTEVNRLRNYVQEQCVKESQGESGFYSLTVPTGGGKTLASVLWALHHAVKNHLQRIIIAIPYTSIIVQTARTLINIFGEDNVLEHHSNVNPKEDEDKELLERLQLATENWDYPIIVTTNVQLFESLFSNKRSDCRKLHNIINSVIIFGVSVLFTTASQPILNGRLDCSDYRESFDALKDIHEIIPVEARLHDKLRRVKLDFLTESMSYDDIAAELVHYDKVLCIVNTRKDAKEIYDRLPKNGTCLHLSRMMCPAHVAATISTIKDVLKDDETKPVRVIATQLIEAGVDIDFPVVFRQEAGLDSILQAAGRCNREGKSEICTTFVFNLTKEHTLPPGFITQSNNARLAMGTNHDWFSPEAMKSYFHQLHSRVDTFDKQQMEALLYKLNCEFEEAANQFHLIDDNTISVIIIWKSSMALYQQLLSQGPSYSLLKELAQYSVNVRNSDFDKLRRIGAIEEPYENIYAITNSKFYHPETGLTLDNQWLEETYII